MKNRTIFFLLFLVSCMGDCQGCYERPVSGRVVGAPEGRITGGEHSMEKFAIHLDPYHSDQKVKEVAAGVDGLYIECLSTRCAALETGQCASFVCRWDWRCSEPHVVQCKLDRVVKCPETEQGNDSRKIQ